MGEISFKAVKNTKYTNASLVEIHITAIIFASQDNLQRQYNGISPSIVLNRLVSVQLDAF